MEGDAKYHCQMEKKKKQKTANLHLSKLYGNSDAQLRYYGTVTFITHSSLTLHEVKMLLFNVRIGKICQVKEALLLLMFLIPTEEIK